MRIDRKVDVGGKSPIMVDAISDKSNKMVENVYRVERGKPSYSQVTNHINYGLKCRVQIHCFSIRIRGLRNNLSHPL
jgi:hypothetical protein